MVRKALRTEPWPAGLSTLDREPPRTLIGPLFACLLDPDRLTALRAASAFGVVVSRLFDADPAAARQVLRDFMWRLNDESGNVAWGIPEAFGEILAAQETLAMEFHRVLAAYIHERDCETGDTFLDLCPLRRGAYWALGRLAHARPKLVLPALPGLVAALGEDDPESRGFAAWALGPLLPLAGEHAGDARAGLAKIASDNSPFELYEDGVLTLTSVTAQAARALQEK